MKNAFNGIVWSDGTRQPGRSSGTFALSRVRADVLDYCERLRDRDGGLPGAVVIDRNVLEWRLDPSSPHRIAGAGDADRRIMIVCNEGYSSSLAAHTLQRLGLPHATDLIGGFQAWAALRPPAGQDRRWSSSP